MEVRVGDLICALYKGVYIQGMVIEVGFFNGIPNYSVKTVIDDNWRIIKEKELIWIKRDGEIYGSAAYCPQCGRQHHDRSRSPIIPAKGKLCLNCTVKDLTKTSIEYLKDN